MQWGLSFQQILNKKISATPSDNDTNAHFSEENLQFSTQVRPTEVPIFGFSRCRNWVFQGYQAQLSEQNRQDFDEKAKNDPPTNREQSRESENNSAPRAHVSYPFRDQAVLAKEPHVSAQELSAIGSVAFRTLLKYSEEPLPTELSASSLLRIKRSLSKKLHPDAGGSAEAFMEMLEALSVLSDEVTLNLEARVAA
jgi:hypothetical protein